MRDEDDIQVPADLLAMAPTAAASPALTKAVRRSVDGPPPEAALGQIWRAGWDDLEALVVILRVDVDGVLASPVSIDPPDGDDRTLIMDETATVLGVSVSAWAGLARTIPTRVLEVCLDRLGNDVTEALIHLHREEAGNMRVPSHTSLGQRVTSPFDPIAQVRAMLTDCLDELAAAEWIPAAQAQHRKLTDLLGKGIDFAALKDALGVSLPAVWEIVRGRAELTEIQARALSQLTGVAGADLLAIVPPLPPELVREIDHPRWRREFNRLRRHRSLSDSALRLDVARGTLRMAARQTGAAAPSWRDRIRQYLAVSGQAVR